MLSVVIAAAAVTAQARIDCNSPVTQTDITVCSGRDAKAADAAMVSEYRIATVILGNMDRELDRKYDKRPTYSAALLASQRAFLTFRKAHCDVEGYSARGGSMEPMLVNVCYEEMAKARTKQLKDMLKLYSGD
jgi:uncharacterized protein YecT (DUF1311 family)